MPDSILTAQQTAELAQHLTKILALEPPPSPKGRYALARWGIACEKPAAEYSKKMGALIESVAVPESIKAGSTGISFEYKPDAGCDPEKPTNAEARELYATESEAINSGSVTLAGVRVITHAELSPCPITGTQEKALIQCGVLEDVEPA